MKMVMRIENLITGEIQKNAVELVDIEYRKENSEQIIRIFIDTENGIDLDTCAQATMVIRNIIDDQGDIPYDRIEVSSPGMDRVIKKDSDFERFNGHKIKVKTNKVLDNRRNYTGVLSGIDKDHINIEIEGEIISIPRDIVTVVRLHPDL